MHALLHLTDTEECSLAWKQHSNAAGMMSITACVGEVKEFCLETHTAIIEQRSCSGVVLSPLFPTAAGWTCISTLGNLCFVYWVKNCIIQVCAWLAWVLFHKIVVWWVIKLVIWVGLFHVLAGEQQLTLIHCGFRVWKALDKVFKYLNRI